MEFITSLKTALVGCIEEVLRSSEVQATSLSAMEVGVRAMLHEVGGEILTRWLEAQDSRYPPDTQPCACGAEAEYVRRRAGMSITLSGRVYYERAYYVCPTCHQGHYPLDQRLGIQPGQMSAEVVKVAALVGVEDAYGTSRELLRQTTLLDLSANSIRAACHHIGEQVIAHETAAIAHSQSLPAQLAQRREVPPPALLYGSMDGFMVRFDDGWHEMKAGAFWTTAPDGKAQSISYYTDLTEASAFSDLVWARGFERGANVAQRLVFIADGARWIWRIVNQHFPDAIQIVDWYHASGYLVKLANAAFGEGTPNAAAWLAPVKEALWHGRLATVMRACHALSARAPQAVADARHYFAANRTRLRYAKFRASGLQIGSGSMESGCKQIALERLKIAGAQWSVEGACKLAKARAAFLSNEVSRLPVSSPQVA